jgi:outer membrane receptor protein involved in Fe transport
MKIYYFILTLFFCSISFAQSTISGSVKDSKNEPIPGVNIKVVGEPSGSVTDGDGKFVVKVTKKPPFTIEVSSIGYATQKVQVSAAGQKVEVILKNVDTQLDEIVVSASRTPERVKESPVTIERMSIKDIKKTASPSFYDGLENLKEVQMNTSSMSFKSINTRGFATVANTRFMQLVDGMDNSSPLLNFVLGNLIGLSEIDVQSVELLPGASSALYGANAFNGILFMNSKSPFTSQGVSSYIKYGQTNQKAAGANEYYDYGVRVAKAFSPYFAGKANFTFMKGTDWFATDYRDRNVSGRTRDHYGYDGLNIYGDEVATPIPAATLPTDNVSRTGYTETDLTDNKVRNAKIDFSLHARPFGTEKLEIIWNSKFGYGNTVYQGANRYYLNNFYMQQHKLEIKGKNFFVRGYTTTEDGGNSYDMTFTAININRLAKSDTNWFTDYGKAYAFASLTGQFPDQAHATARKFADYNINETGLPLTPNVDPLDPTAPNGVRFAPGSTEFKNAFNKVINEADVRYGSKLVDNSRIYHSDANYNFKDIIKVAEIQVGGSYRLYELNSHGRIYTDKESQINYTDYGAYTQIQKKLLEDKLKLTGSVRYDKSKNFDGSLSPRISAVYALDAQKNHVFRGSFQTGFRNPTTQDQYIGFNVGNAVLVGSAPDNLTRYTEVRGSGGIDGIISATGVNILTNVINGGVPTSTVTLNGNNAYFNSYTSASAQQFAAFASANPTNLAGAVSLLRKTNVGYVKPETVKAIELGYRGNAKGFSIDVNGYYNVYNNFIGNLTVVAPYYGTVADNIALTASGGFAPNPTNSNEQTIIALANKDYRAYQLYTNTDTQIKSLGFGVGLSKKLPKNFEVGANYNYAQFDFDQDKDPSFEAGFNTPKHRVKGFISNDKLIGNLGFNLSARYNTEYKYESSFADGMIDAATVVDAQLSYGMPKLKSTLKFGATNIGGKEYRQILGAGAIGQQYFASLVINP